MKLKLANDFEDSEVDEIIAYTRSRMEMPAWEVLGLYEYDKVEHMWEYLDSEFSEDQEMAAIRAEAQLSTLRQQDESFSEFVMTTKQLAARARVSLTTRSLWMKLNSEYMEDMMRHNSQPLSEFVKLGKEMETLKGIANNHSGDDDDDGDREANTRAYDDYDYDSNDATHDDDALYEYDENEWIN